MNIIPCAESGQSDLSLTVSNSMESEARSDMATISRLPGRGYEWGKSPREERGMPTRWVRCAVVPWIPTRSALQS